MVGLIHSIYDYQGERETSNFMFNNSNVQEIYTTGIIFEVLDDD